MNHKKNITQTPTKINGVPFSNVFQVRSASSECQLEDRLVMAVVEGFKTLKVNEPESRPKEKAQY